MDSRRRSMIIGLGSLAFGSGAVLSSAAFNDAVSPASDMRVVVDEPGLFVEPGIIFRDGDDPDDPFDPGGEEVQGARVYNNGGSDGSGTELFGGNGNAGLEDADLDDFDDSPAVSANDAANDDLRIEIGLPLNIDDRIGNPAKGLLQVRNEATETKDVAVRFESFGSDTDGPQDGRGGDVDESDVVDIFQFERAPGGGGGPARISSTDVGDDVEDQRIEDVMTLDAGETKQIILEYDTTIADDDVQDAAGTDGTADLVDVLRFGTDPE